MRTLDFTPSDSVFPIKLPSLHSCGTFGVLPWQLLSGTLYPSLSKNLSSILPSLARFQLAAVNPTAQAGGLYGDFCNRKLGKNSQQKTVGWQGWGKSDRSHSLKPGKITAFRWVFATKV